MSKLKQLSSDDLEEISNHFGEILNHKVSKLLPSKEIEDLDLDITVNYENNQLDVDVDVNVLIDALSDISEREVSNVIDESYLIFDAYIDDNYRV